MKKLIIACFVFLGFSLVSCLDTEEKITIKEDNSGTYQLTMAIGNSPELQMALQQSGQSLEKKDTIIYFKDFTDTATTLSVEEKSILENGKLHVAMNEDIKAEFELPFKSIDQLLYIKQHMFEMISKIKPQSADSSSDDMLSGMDMMGGSGGQGMGGAGKLLNPTQDGFVFTMDHHMISNKIKDKASLTEAFTSDSMQMIKQMLPMIGDLNYTTTFVLPSPVKHYSGGADSKLSEDKKTISFINSLSGLLDKPESLEYTLEY